jgi:hypothetical protein
MTTTYRSVTTTPGGTLVITNTETAVHILLKGTAVGFTVSFDDAQNFTADRLYRFTNNSTQNVAFENYTASITATLLPGNVLQAALTDETTAAGDWNFEQHVGGSSSGSGMATDYDLVQYARLAGRSGGQTLIGGTGSGDDLTLSSTSHGTKGTIIFGTSSVYDEVNDRWGFGTTAIPHGAVGYAKVALEGTNASANGPHMQWTTASDNYPLAQLLPWEHNDIHLALDAYYDGAWRASYKDSNYEIAKVANLLQLRYDNGIDPGNAITWEAGVAMSTSGNIGIGLTAWGTSAAKVLGIANGTAPSTSPADAVQIWAADRGGTAGKSGLHVRSEDATSYVFADYMGIGTTTPSAIVDIERAGTVKSIVDFLEITNTVNAADMDGTGTAIFWRQWYYDAVTPALADAARIVVATENDWTSVTQDAYMAFHIAGGRVLSEAVRIDSSGNLMVGGTTSDMNANRCLHLFSGQAPSAHVDESIYIFSVDDAGGNATLGLVVEEAVTDNGSAPLTVNHSLPIRINGTEYKLCLNN